MGSTRRLLKFVKEYFNNYVPDKTIKESILIENPKPTNLCSPRKLHDFLSELLKEKNKTSELASEATLEKVSNKTLNIMGPLSKLWLEVEKVTSHEGDEEPPCL